MLHMYKEIFNDKMCILLYRSSILAYTGVHCTQFTVQLVVVWYTTLWYCWCIVTSVLTAGTGYTFNCVRQHDIITSSVHVLRLGIGRTTHTFPSYPGPWRNFSWWQAAGSGLSSPRLSVSNFSPESKSWMVEHFKRTIEGQHWSPQFRLDVWSARYGLIFFPYALNLISFGCPALRRQYRIFVCQHTYIHSYIHTYI